MPNTIHIPVKSLRLDLKNFRTVEQEDEAHAVHALISIKPDWFWALTESLLDDGYHPTENIIVLKSGRSGREMVVKEGNRRIGALKLIFCHISSGDQPVPSHIQSQIDHLTEAWKKENRSVPCAVYDRSEAELVDRIVAMTHGKGTQAGRDTWKAVARARHNRDINNANEPALDLLEKYLEKGRNLTPDQRERWSGEYPLTVLDDAIKRIASRFGLQTAREVADRYPRIKYRQPLEDILRDVGQKTLTFKAIRSTSEDFAEAIYGIAGPEKPGGPSSPENATSKADASGSNGGNASGAGTGSRETQAGRGKGKAAAGNTSRSVKDALRRFVPAGPNREKLVILKDEAARLTLSKHPHSFCFLLRSMFELSAKAYCKDHKATGGPSMTKSDGRDRTLVSGLRDITKHLTRDKADEEKKRLLHGAIVDLAKPESVLSVTSMNQLIHNPNFIIDEPNICIVFHNIFPLLQEMNR